MCGIASHGDLRLANDRSGDDVRTQMPQRLLRLDRIDVTKSLHRQDGHVVCRQRVDEGRPESTVGGHVGLEVGQDVRDVRTGHRTTSIGEVKPPANSVARISNACFDSISSGRVDTPDRPLLIENKLEAAREEDACRQTRR